MEREVIELLHYKEHSDSNVGRQTEGGDRRQRSKEAVAVVLVIVDGLLK